MKKILTLWAALGVMYVAMETVFRGYSHPSMLIVGGLCGVLVGAINQHPRFYNAPVVLQSAAGALIVLAVEFLAGCVLNLWLGLDVWDYTGQPEDTARWFIWLYESVIYKREPDKPALPMYSLASVYLDFIRGR